MTADDDFFKKERALKRRNYRRFGVVLAMVTVINILIIRNAMQPSPKVTAAETKSGTPTLPVFTTQTIADYDGSDSTKPILLAMDGKVYDVTTGKEFYAPGGPYHFLAGTDATAMLHNAGGAIVQRKYPVVGTFKP